MQPVRFARVVIVVGILLGGAAVAGADTVISQKGGLVAGQLQVSELVVATAGGEVRLSPREVLTVTLGGISGDVVTLRNGRRLAGRLEHPDYTMRLPSGQTIGFARGDLDQLHFSPR